MPMRPCLDCGELAEASRCPEHAPTATELRRTSARERGYDGRHDRLSKRARKLQPWCSDCLTTEALTLHHTEEAWRRHEARKPARLTDYEVLCGPCNNRRGSPRVGLDKPRGGDPSKQRRGPEVEAKFASHTERGGRLDLLSDSEPVAGRVGNDDPLLSVEHPQHSTCLNVVGGVSLVTPVRARGRDGRQMDGMVVALRTQYLKVHPRSLS